MKKFIYVFLLLLVSLSIYGLYEKDRRQRVVSDFKVNKPIVCNDKKILLSEGWMIHNNRFFTNGEEFYTIIFCKSEN